MDKLGRMNVGDGRARPGRPAATISYEGGGAQEPAARQPTQRILLLTKLKKTSMRMGAVTQAFFSRGDELVDTDWENLPHDDPMLVPAKLGFRSFNRIPHHRGRIFVMLLMIGAVALLVVDRHHLRELPDQTVAAAQWVADEALQLWARAKELVGSHR
jgi:hypothetical protein